MADWQAQSGTWTPKLDLHANMRQNEQEALEYKVKSLRVGQGPRAPSRSRTSTRRVRAARRVLKFRCCQGGLIRRVLLVYLPATLVAQVCKLVTFPSMLGHSIFLTL